MNKNPFVPQPTYPSQQPPLPPGPPPPQPSQPDYSAYWAAAAAQQQQQQQPQPPTVGAYNPQQSALYANYGYGGQQALHWQQQQQRGAQPGYPQPPPPVAQPPPPPPAQPAYNPYQPGYQQPYAPQPPPPPHMPYPHQSPPQQMHHQPPQQQFFPPPPQQQQQQQRHNHNVHHSPPQQLPPAKRPRFDGPNNNAQFNRGPIIAPMQPQFQSPQGQIGPIGGFPGPAQANNRGGPPGVNHVPIARGGQMAGRGNDRGRGRGMPMGGDRGGIGRGRGGRGGSMFIGGDRGGRGGAGQGLPLRGRGSRGGGFNNGQDFHNRRGGSFGAGGDRGGGHHQPGNNLRGRGSGNRGGGSGGGVALGPRDAASQSVAAMGGTGGSGKENRRTLTDFKLAGIQIDDLKWTWGMVPPPPSSVATEATAEPAVAGVSDAPVKEEPTEGDAELAQTQPADDAAASQSLKAENTLIVEPEEPSHSSGKTASTTVTAHASASAPESVSPPPSRVRIYFHTPVSADDSHPIPHAVTGLSITPSDSRKGKRKKLEDDDGDLEEGRARRPPPQPSSQLGKAEPVMNIDADGTARGSAAPSVGDTASMSEADWLMAAIVEDDGNADAEGDDDHDMLHVSQIVEEVDEPQESGGGDDGDRAADVNAHVNGDVPLDQDGDHSQCHAPDEIVSGGTTSLGSGGGDNAAAATAAGDSSADAHSQEVEPATDTSALVDLSGSSTQKNASGSALSEPEPASASPALNSVVSADVISQTQERFTDDAQSASLQVPAAADPPELGGESLASTLVASQATQAPSQDTTMVSGESLVEERPTAPDAEVSNDQEHLPEPPASPTSNTLLSTSSTSTYGEAPPLKVDDKSGPRIPSANRLSISYAGGNRRLVINAEVVEKLKVFRREGRIEVLLTVDKDDEGGLKGILMEGLSDVTKSYLPLQSTSDAYEADPTLPPFSALELPSSLSMTLHLDTDKPLSGPKWVKSGDVQEWLKSMFGRMFWVAGDAAGGWEKKIEVADPDPAPTIWTVLEGWAHNSPVGAQTERQRFLKVHMSETDNLLEILLRLVRGERSTAFPQNSSAITPPSVFGPLLNALGPGSSHGAQQTHVSLAVLAMFRMAVEYAEKAEGEKGKADVETRAGELIRCLPSHLVYKSLDGIFKEWRVEKKGGR